MATNNPRTTDDSRPNKWALLVEVTPMEKCPYVNCPLCGTGKFEGVNSFPPDDYSEQLVIDGAAGD